jgi:hypothetical protein
VLRLGKKISPGGSSHVREVHNHTLVILVRGQLCRDTAVEGHFEGKKARAGLGSRVEKWKVYVLVLEEIESVA